MDKIPYSIQRNPKRKTIDLVVTPDAELVVRAPCETSIETIERCITRRRKWINEKLLLVKNISEQHPIIEVRDGVSIPYLGDDYIISILDVSEISVAGKTIQIPSIYADRQSLLDWLYHQAEEFILERVNFYSRQIGATYSSIQITDAKARWGSCGRAGGLNFSWRLIMCPMPVIDYVVVHELSHLQYRGHTTSFWLRVSTILPNYREQQEWLLQNRKLMSVM